MKHWCNNSIFYHIYPLGYCGSLFKNNFCNQPENRLQLIRNEINHLKEININAVYLGPVFESTFHGYDTVDYYNVDRRLGNNDDLKYLVEDLHKNDIKVIFDCVFNHVGRDFWAFKDVLHNRENSPYCSWFSGLNFYSNNGYNDNLSYDGWHNYYDLVKLNLNNYYVKEHLFNAVKMWIEKFNIDGLRIDAADCMDLNFLSDLSKMTKEIKNDFWIVGEVVHGDYRKYVFDGGLDSVTNYEGYKGLFSSHNDNNFFEIAYSLNRQFAWNGIYTNIPLYNFADNHDVNRIKSTAVREEYLYTIYGLLFTMPGVPSLYYGSEWGIEGKKENGSDNNLRPSYNHIKNNYKINISVYEAIKKLSAIRLNSKALKYGKYEQVYLSHNQLAFIRQQEDELMLVIVNSEFTPVKLNINYDFGKSLKFVDILNNNEEIYTSGKGIIVDNVYPNWLRILKAEK